MGLETPIEGSWWLPGQGRRSRRGVLREHPDGFELTLRIAWPLEQVQALDRAERVTLLGRAESGRPVTLAYGFLKAYKLPSPEVSEATFHFDLVILGSHFPDFDDACVSELTARIPALDEWLGSSGMTVDLIRSPREVSIHFSTPENLEFELEPGLQLVFDFHRRGPVISQPQLRANLEQEVWLTLRATPPRKSAELQIVLRRLANLFSLLVGEPIEYQKMYVRSPRALERQGNRNQSVRSEVLFSPLAVEFVDKVIPAHRMLLRYSDVQDTLPSLFQRWLRSYEQLQPSYDAFFGLQRRDPGYQEPRLLGLVQALESLHRRIQRREPKRDHQARLERILKPLDANDRKWLKGKLRHSHEPQLRDRLVEMLEPYGDLFGATENRVQFAERVAATRNYFTHYDPAMKDRAVPASKLLPHLFRLRVLFVLQCLLQLGFTAEEARHHIERNDRLNQMVRFGKI